MKKYVFFLTICVAVLCSCHLESDNEEISQVKETSLNYINAPVGKIEEGEMILSEEDIKNQENWGIYEITEIDLKESNIIDMIQHDIMGDDAEATFPLYGKKDVFLSKIPVVVYDIEQNSLALYYNYFVFDNELNVDNGVTVNIEINNKELGEGVQISDCIDDLYVNNVLKYPDEEFCCLYDGRGLALLDKDNNTITNNKNVDIKVEGDCFSKLKNMGLSFKGSDILNDSNLITIKMNE